MKESSENACDNFKESQSRRDTLKMAFGLGVGLAVVSTFGDAFVETAYATTGKADRILIILSLRGGCDGLSLVVPHGDPVYYQARPAIAIPKDKLLRGDSFFGLHPEFAPLLPMWDARKIATVQATGQIITTRSHFAAMEEVEDADPGSSARVGWLNRLLAQRSGTPTWLDGMQIGSSILPTQLAGPHPTFSTPSLQRLSISGPSTGPEGVTWRSSIESLWKDNTGEIGKGGNAAIAVTKSLSAVRSQTDSDTIYPAGDLANALKATAKVLKADSGAEVITVDQGSWDHHQWVGNLSAGNIKKMVVPLATSLAAFFKDLGPLADKVTLVTISEFGRRVKENANQGLDHGHGNVMFIMGAGVKGGYYGTWPGLENNANADLPVTTDYRNILAEVVSKIYPERSLPSVFPQFTHKPIGFMNSL